MKTLTFELQMSHICDMRGHALSAAVAILRQSNQVALAARSYEAYRDSRVNPHSLVLISLGHTFPLTSLSRKARKGW